MQITIDTQKDSKEDIRKAVALLSSIAEGKKEHSNIFEDSSPGLRLDDSSESAGKNAFANMFGSGEKKLPVLGEDSLEKEEEKEEDLGVELMEY